MLYSFIPPILIVASLIGIIVMLMKKSAQVAQMPPEELAERMESMPENTGLIGKVSWRVKSVKGDDIKHFWLAILEKITRKSRMLFLKLESRFGNWSNDIRSKRQERAERKIQQRNSFADRENDILQKLRSYQSEKTRERSEIIVGDMAAEEPVITTVAVEETVVVAGRGNRKRTSARKTVMIDEESIRPIISEKATKAKPRTEIKDRLEELLIERIAVNPKDIEAYERLGEYYMEIKSYTDAKECFKQVLKLNPADRNVKYRMRRLETLLAKK